MPRVERPATKDRDKSRESHQCDAELREGTEVYIAFHIAPAAQRIGVNRLATALTGSDPADTVCRQTAQKVN